MSCRILFAGDIHIGRRPGGLRDDLDEFGVRPSELTPAAAWHSTVEWACRNSVHAVVLAGDVVESMEDRFEAFGHLERGIARLADAGIETLGVAGNHDVHALPRLADRIGGFRLVGRDGAWERVEIAGDETKVHLFGWSFRDRSFPGNPLDSFDLARDEGTAAVGVLHCDLDAAGGSYAPVPRRDLTERHPLDGWFLGHIHVPSYEGLAAERPVGYLGSLSGLDAGEPGARGPWLVEVDGPGAVRAAHIPLAPIRYEQEAVAVAPISGADEEGVRDSTDQHLRAALERVHDRLLDEESTLHVVACRLKLEGKSEHHRAVRRFVNDRSVWPTLDITPFYFIEKIEDAGGPTVDIRRIAGEPTLPGMLAARIVALEEGGEEADALVRDASRELESALSDPRWSGVAEAPQDPDQVRQLLRRAATRALEDLLAQKEPDGAAGGAP